MSEVTQEQVEQYQRRAGALIITYVQKVLEGLDSALLAGADASLSGEDLEAVAALIELATVKLDVGWDDDVEGYDL